MSAVNDNKKLFELSIPSTHDSAMWEGSGAAWTFGWAIARTQFLNIANQLRLGIRGFDIRVSSNGWIYHGAAASTLSFEEFLKQVSAFLVQHPKETVVIKVKDENMDVDNTSQAASAKRNYENALAKYRNFLFNPNGAEPWNLDYRLSNLRGKMVIVNHWHHLVSTSRVGGFKFGDYINRHQHVQDEYNAPVNEKIEKAQRMFGYSNEDHSNKLYLNFLSKAGGFGSHPDNFAREINPKINKYLNEHQEYKKLGMVFMDFPGPSLVEAIFKTNYYISDRDINNRYLGNPLNRNSFTANAPVAETNTFTINGPLNGLHYEVTMDNRTIGSGTANSNSVNITLQNGEKFSVGKRIAIKIFKMTPENPFYESRKFHEISFNIVVLDNAYLNKLNSLKTRVQNLMNDFNTLAPNVKNYINTKFLAELNKIPNSSDANYRKLNELETSWNGLESKLFKVRTSLNSFNGFINPFKQLVSSSYVSQDNKNKVNGLQTELNSLVNTAFNQSNTPESINVSGIENFASKNQHAYETYNQLDTSYKQSQYLNLNSRLNTVFSKFNYGKSKYSDLIVKAQTDLNAHLNNLLNSATSGKNNQKLFQTLHKQMSKPCQQLKKL
ncbi:hypothetical protein FIV53_00545 [Mycoplasma nasistruthionis]|uniref:1-phosphatidylinositol phosphodiesterase n=2 Tax=Mycoplasma nasistruthionis TaxID=353852 RepID=A0A4Y6I5B9_9MOLU|nr:hypothetical protein FIV53_00545 [Mycoplasma nasistruthionis]